MDDNYCDMTNLSWVIDGPGLQTSHGINSVKVINDFAAVGYGVLDLQDDEVVTLNGPPKDPTGPVAVLGPGTGGAPSIVHCIYIIRRLEYTRQNYIRSSYPSIISPTYHPSGGSPRRSWAALPLRDTVSRLSPHKCTTACTTDVRPHVRPHVRPQSSRPPRVYLSFSIRERLFKSCRADNMGYRWG